MSVSCKILLRNFSSSYIRRKVMSVNYTIMYVNMIHACYLYTNCTVHASILMTDSSGGFGRRIYEWTPMDKTDFAFLSVARLFACE